MPKIVVFNSEKMSRRSGTQHPQALKDGPLRYRKCNRIKLNFAAFSKILYNINSGHKISLPVPGPALLF